MPDEGKVTVFVTSGPETPQRCATPFIWPILLRPWTMKRK
jgi:predicted peroxiredoxin